jgi:chromate transporter
MQTRLSYLFWTFLKIGALSFGGHMGLIAVIQRTMADRDKRLSHEMIMEGVSLASVLPGPMAVNVVAFLGYRLRGVWGAAISYFSVLLPAFFAMVVLAWFYFEDKHLSNMPLLLHSMTAAVGGIVLAAGVRLFMKELRSGHLLGYLLCLLAFTLILCVNSYFITLGLILVGSVSGFLTAAAPSDQPEKEAAPSLPLYTWASLLLLGACVLQFVCNAQRFVEDILLKMSCVFSGISLTLFGGGYVMIPVMQSMLVDSMHWLTHQEFVDAIAFSQTTPGPILVSTTFVGYKMAGLQGAVLATLAIFLPSALLMITLSGLLMRYRRSAALQRVLTGIKAVVVGMILASAIKIMDQDKVDHLMLASFGLSFILNYRFNLNPVWIILGSAIAGSVLTLAM